MQRIYQILLIVSILGLSWLAMMAVHEFGHVFHAWLSGGQVARVILDPLTFSRTDFAHNPRPLFVAWGGPIWGCVIPVLLWAGVHLALRRYGYLVRFLAGFCLIANGAYIAGGVLLEAGDAADMLRHGSPWWVLVLFGLPAMALGLWHWHGLGPHFGLGRVKTDVDRCAAVGMAVAFVILFLAELLAS